MDQNFPANKMSGPTEVVSFVNSTKWNYWLNRPYNPFWASFFWLGLQEKYFKEVGLEQLAGGGTLYQYPDLYYSDIYADKADLWRKSFFAQNNIFKLSEDLVNIHTRCISELENILSSTDTIENRLRKYFESIRLYVPFLWLVLPIEKHYSEQIDRYFKDYFGEDYKRKVADITLPTKKNVYGLMIDELLSGISVEEVHKKYAWMKSRDGFSSFYTLEELEEIKRNHKENYQIEEETVKIDNLQWLIEELKELSFFRTDRTDKLNEMLNKGRILFKELAEKNNLTLEELKMYDAQSLLENKLEKYSSTFSYAFFDDEYIIQNEPFLSNLEEHAITEIKGSIAFKGKVTGVVKIVTHSDDIQKVKEGDILVSQMTFPSFISAMQKAAGFVTDEGGITCHAAIIAREMKKPCIIGTKNATKILKDGDLIEVDANSGVVRKI